MLRASLHVATASAMRCVVLGVLLLSGCSAAREPQPATLVFDNARVYTMNAAQPHAEAVAVLGNRIVFVGSSDAARAYKGPATQVVDLQGKTLMPGFISGHDHFIASDWVFAGVDLYDISAMDELLEKIRSYAQEHPDLPIILGMGWNHGLLGRYPTARELDQAVPDRPAFLLDYTVHDGWLNSAALRAAGVDKATPDTQPGTTYWVRDAAGNPTGVGVEAQWMDAYVAAGAWDAHTAIRASTEKLFALAASNGTTAYQDLGLVTPNLMNAAGMKADFRTAMALLAGMAERKTLLLRTQAMPLFKAPDADPDDIAAFTREMMQQYDNDMLRVRTLKIHPASNIAPFLEPYAEPGKVGRFGVSPARIKSTVLAANAAGVDVAIHVWGDAAARAALDAFEASRSAGHGQARNSLHHLGFLHPDDYPRIVAQGIGVNVTPVFSTDWGGQDAAYVADLGRARVLAEISRYPDLARDGVRLTLSSDVPSTPPAMQAPLFNVQAAVTLRTPGDAASRAFPPQRQGLTVEQALRAVTIDAAWQLRMEDKIGSIEPGKYADVVVLDQHPLQVEVDAIANIQVVATMMDGRFTYTSAGWR